MLSELSLSQKAQIKERIMAGLSEERRREQKVKEQIKRYLSNKKQHIYKGEKYYRLSDYKATYHVSVESLQAMGSAVQEVELKQVGYTAHRTKKGYAKWDSIRECILITVDRIRIYYKPFHVEEG